MYIAQCHTVQCPLLLPLIRTCARAQGCFPDETPPRPAWCECHKGFVGGHCETVETRPCPNKCSGRGTCSRGFCHCQPPWFGLDCSRSKVRTLRHSLCRSLALLSLTAINDLDLAVGCHQQLQLHQCQLLVWPALFTPTNRTA